MRYLVTGGAGYIGAHVARNLLGAGASVTVVDDLSTGSMILVDYLRKAGGNRFCFVRADLGDRDAMEKIFAASRFAAVFHFAASSLVGESMREPEKYHRNNVLCTEELLRLCLGHDIKRFIFSSTASVYGEGGEGLLPEDAPLAPVSVYGKSKLECERRIRKAAEESVAFRYLIFRFFNVAGASEDSGLGEVTPEFCHLIKAAAQAALGMRQCLQVFGNDYPTLDGTGIRDYIHVEDLATAHVMALDYLENEGSDTFNVGYGKGFSVYEVINSMKRISGVDFDVEVIGRRPGDPAWLLADASRIRRKMGWQPRYDDLDRIVGSAFEWERKMAEIGT